MCTLLLEYCCVKVAVFLKMTKLVSFGLILWVFMLFIDYYMLHRIPLAMHTNVHASPDRLLDNVHHCTCMHRVPLIMYMHTLLWSCTHTQPPLIMYMYMLCVCMCVRGGWFFDVTGLGLFCSFSTLSASVMYFHVPSIEHSLHWDLYVHNYWSCIHAHSSNDPIHAVNIYTLNTIQPAL